MKNLFLALLATLFISAFAIAQPLGKTFKLTKYKCNGTDTLFDNTLAFERAIDDAFKNGGGSVLVPKGRYLIRPIVLKTGVYLYLEAGAELLGSTNFNDYPYATTRWEGTVCQGFRPLIYAKDASNTGVMGKGTINGRGEVWWTEQRRLKALGDQKFVPNNKWAKELTVLNANCPKLDSSRWMFHSQFLRPALMQFYNCQNVTVQGITLTKSPFWHLHPVFCKNVLIDGITVISPYDSPNTDGIDPESCDGIIIRNSYFDVGDDCIVLKSGINQDGRKYNVPCQNVIITQCKMIHGHGAVVIGSEMSGGVKDVLVSNCEFKHTDAGVRIKTERGRGAYVRNVYVNNITMEDIKKDAIIVTMLYQLKPMAVTPKFDETTPVIENIQISDVKINGSRRLLRIMGLPESKIKGVHLKNVSAENIAEGDFIVDAEDIAF